MVSAETLRRLLAYLGATPEQLADNPEQPKCDATTSTSAGAEDGHSFKPNSSH
jgi:hypothetical protein